MMLKKVFLSFILLGFTITAHAYDLKPYDYFISLSAGPGWTDAGKTQTIALQPDVINTYVPCNLTNTRLMANGEVFLGLQKTFCENIQSQFGLAFYASSHADLNGYIQVDGDPNFQNFEYEYKINHTHIALKSKWIYENAFNMNPYLSASIGVGYNHSYGYSNTPLISQEIPPPPFQSHTKTAFSYTIGAGFQHTIDCHFTVGLGYELVSWGESSLDRADGQTSDHGLRLSNLYTQGVAFNVSYLL